MRIKWMVAFLVIHVILGLVAAESANINAASRAPGFDGPPALLDSPVINSFFMSTTTVVEDGNGQMVRISRFRLTYKVWEYFQLVGSLTVEVFRFLSFAHYGDLFVGEWTYLRNILYAAGSFVTIITVWPWIGTIVGQALRVLGGFSPFSR